ncbi:unnamed protein product [Urochloa humidicola]
MTAPQHQIFQGRHHLILSVPDFPANPRPGAPHPPLHATAPPILLSTPPQPPVPTLLLLHFNDLKGAAPLRTRAGEGGAVPAEGEAGQGNPGGGVLALGERA